MCRLLGVVPSNDVFVDPELLESFRTLALCGKVKIGASPGHRDGWGFVTWESSEPKYLGREPRDASSDPIYDKMLKEILLNPVKSNLIGHLRKASRGSKILENTHPFTIEKWAFAHNGTIRKLNLHDRTDSEWFFHSLMYECAKNPSTDMIELIKKRVEAVRSLYNYTSITFLLSNGKTMYAYRDYTCDEDYYTLFYTKTKDALIICQEKLFESNWKEIEKSHLLEIQDGSAIVHDLSPH